MFSCFLPGELPLDVIHSMTRLPKCRRYGQPTHTFARKVIEEGVVKSLRIEFYPISFLVYRCQSIGAPPPQSFELSKNATLATIKENIITPHFLTPLSNIRPGLHPVDGPFRVWKIDSTTLPDDDDEQIGYTPQRVMESKATHLFASYNVSIKPAQVTLEDALVGDGDRLIIEVQEGGTWQVKLPMPQLSTNQAGPSTSTSSATAAQAPLFGSAPDFFSSMEASSSTSPPREWSSNKANSSTATTSLSMVRTRSQAPARVRGTTGLNNL